MEVRCTSGWLDSLARLPGLLNSSAPVPSTARRRAGNLPPCFGRQLVVPATPPSGADSTARSRSWVSPARLSPDPSVSGVAASPRSRLVFVHSSARRPRGQGPLVGALDAARRTHFAGARAHRSAPTGPCCTVQPQLSCGSVGGKGFARLRRRRCSAVSSAQTFP